MDGLSHSNINNNNINNNNVTATKVATTTTVSKANRKPNNNTKQQQQQQHVDDDCDVEPKSNTTAATAATATTAATVVQKPTQTAAGELATVVNIDVFDDQLSLSSISTNSRLSLEGPMSLCNGLIDTNLMHFSESAAVVAIAEDNDSNDDSNDSNDDESYDHNAGIEQQMPKL
ncbi:hypothetical protein ACLKA7_000162 [Drosophila subpalustris]